MPSMPALRTFGRPARKGRIRYPLCPQGLTGPGLPAQGLVEPAHMPVVSVRLRTSLLGALGYVVAFLPESDRW
jgi:hypothetical protein